MVAGRRTGLSASSDGTVIVWSLTGHRRQAGLRLDALYSISWGRAGAVVGGLNGLAVFDLR